MYELMIDYIPFFINESNDVSLSFEGSVLGHFLEVSCARAAF